MQRKKISKTRQQIHNLYEENELANLKQNQTRARSFSIGTTSGGVIEVGMRGDFSSLWYLLQPVESVEIIQQLAAACGLDVALRPKKDFATWRGWEETLPSSVHWLGAGAWQIQEVERKQLEQSKSEEKLLRSPDHGEEKDNEKDESE